MDQNDNNSFSDSKNNFRLDDIDEFFYENFTELIEDRNFSNYKNITNNKVEEIEIISLDEGKEIEIISPDEGKEIEVLDIEDFKEIEFLDLSELEKIEFLDLSEIKEIEFLDLDEIIDESNAIKFVKESEDNQDELNEETEKTITIESKKNINKTKKIIMIIVLIILLIALIFVIYKIIKWNLNNNSIDKQVEDIQSSVVVEEVVDNENTIIVNPIIEDSNNIEDNNQIQQIDKNNDYWKFIEQPLISVDFSQLLKKNNDTVGWLQVSGTNINYPIVKYTDNSYYLNHSFDKNYNDAGWIFVDYRNNLIDDKNMIIYGHSRLNLTMFGTLKNVIGYNWYSNSDNHLIKLSTINNNTSWQVFSTYTIEEENYYLKTQFSDDNEYLEFLNTLKNRSIYNYNVNINEHDRILTLSTCYTDNKRVVLHAKLIKMENR